MEQAISKRSKIYDDVAELGARFASIRVRGRISLGLEMERGILDVAATAAALNLPVPPDLDDLLKNGTGMQIYFLIEAVQHQPEAARLIDPGNVQFAPLVMRTEKIICVGFNCRRHAEETDTPIPKVPALLSKNNNALNYKGGTIQLPTCFAQRFDFETELVIVFGRECRDVPEDKTLEYVAGYATGSDFSARELQQATTQFMIGQTSDGFAPIGPWLVTRDLVPNLSNLRLRTYVNGKQRQDWNTSDMIFNCRQLVSFASGIMTLKAGDIFFTGTPQGVILGEKTPPEQRQWLKAGDEIVSSIDGLGELRFQLA